MSRSVLMPIFVSPDCRSVATAHGLEKQAGAMDDAPMEQTEIRPFTADDRDWLVARHAALYAQDEGFDDTFGPLVASIIDAFISDHDPICEAG